MAKSYPAADGAAQDLLAREHFIAYIEVGELRIQLRSARPTTLEAAINLATELELIRELERSNITPDAKVRGVSDNKPDDRQLAILLETVESLRQDVRALQVTVQNLTKAQTSNASSVRGPSYPESQGFNRGPRGRGDACWECGCDRHLRKRMPLRTGKIEGAGKEGQMPAPLPDYTTGLQISVSRSEQGVGVFISAQVGGVDCVLLIDTGAQVSVVSKQFWLKVTNGGSALMPYAGTVSVADGGQINIVGKWSTVCQIGMLGLATEFLVADIPLEEIILGTDFLMKFGAVIDLSTSCFKLMGNSIPLYLENASQKTRTVSVRQDVTVPPRTEVIIPGSIEGMGTECIEGMLELC